MTHVVFKHGRMNRGPASLKGQSIGFGMFAAASIPARTTVLIERAFTFPTPRPSTADAMFELIARALAQHPAPFLALCPFALDKRVIDHALIAKAHAAHCPGLDAPTARLYAAKYMRNAFGFRDRPALLFAGATFNHASDPNVAFKRVGDTMVFTTVRDVAKGGQLFVRYGAARSNNGVREQYAF